MSGVGEWVVLSECVWIRTNIIEDSPLSFFLSFFFFVVFSFKYAGVHMVSVRQQLFYRDTIMAFKCMTGRAPEYLSEKFIKRCEVTSRKTRNSQMLNIPLFRTSSGQRTFYYRTVTLWNSLQQELKLCKSVSQFKCSLRRKLLSNFLAD